MKKISTTFLVAALIVVAGFLAYLKYWRSDAPMPPEKPSAATAFKPSPSPTPITPASTLVAQQSEPEFQKPYRVTDDDREAGLSGIALSRFKSGTEGFWTIIARDNCAVLATLRANHGTCDAPFAIAPGMKLRIRKLTTEDRRLAKANVPLPVIKAGEAVPTPHIDAKMQGSSLAKKTKAHVKATTDAGTTAFVRDFTANAHVGATPSQLYDADAHAAPQEFSPKPASSDVDTIVIDEPLIPVGTSPGAHPVRPARPVPPKSRERPSTSDMHQ